MFGILDTFTKVSHTAPDDPMEIVGSHSKVTMASIIAKYCPTFVNGYTVWLHPFLLNSHFQTAYSQFVDGRDIPVRYQRYMLSYPDKGEGAVDVVDIDGTLSELSGQDLAENENLKGKTVRDNDGDLIELSLPFKTEYFADRAVFEAQLENSKKPMLVLMHGLCGGSQEAYIKSLIKSFVALNGKEFEIVVLNSRGCSNTIIKTPRLYNGLWTDDLRYFINEKVLKYNKDREIYMIGYSLGAAVLTNYLAQESRTNCGIINNNIKLAVVVSACWDMMESSSFLQRSFFSREVYSTSMCKFLFKLIERNYSQLKRSKDIDVTVLDKCVNDKPGKLKYLHEFDYHFTSKIFGLNNHEQYYRFASPITRIHQIRVPMLIINSLDDPIVGPVVPTVQVAQNPYLYMLTTDHGGHVCWYDRNGDQWYNNPVSKFIAGFRREVSKGKVEVSEESLPRCKAFQMDRLVVPGSYSEVEETRRN